MADSLLSELRRRNVFKVGVAYLVLSWIVIQVTSIAVPALHLPQWVNSLVFYFGVIGFPFALFFTWAFEITPEGIKRESEVEQDESITHITGRKLDFTIIGLLIIALGYFIWESRFDSNNQVSNSEQTANNRENLFNNSAKENSATGTSIAVLPFVNMSSDSEQEYFTDGISEEILNLLAKIPKLHVTSRSSAFSFKGKEIIISDIANKLGVKNILDGSVRKSGTTIRITAQLIEAGTDKHLWSQTYDRELVDIFKIQDEISAAIVLALKDKLGLETKISARDTAHINMSAYNEYLKGRFFIEKRNRVNIEKALNHFKQATEIEPNYALAWTEVARANLYLMNSSDTYGNTPPDEALMNARPAAKKALLLDPSLSEAHAMMGMIFQSEFEFKKARYYYEKAIELNPNYDDAYNWLAYLSLLYPNWIETTPASKRLELTTKAVSLSPLSIFANFHHVMSFIALGQYEKANTITQQMIEIDPFHTFTYLALINLSLTQGNYAKAIDDTEKLFIEYPDVPFFKGTLAFLYDSIGLKKHAITHISHLKDDSLKKILHPLFKNDIEGYISAAREHYPLTDNQNQRVTSLIRADAESITGNYPEAIHYYLKSQICNLCDELIYSYQQTEEDEIANKLLAERKKRFEKLKNAGVKYWFYNSRNYSGDRIIEIVGMNIANLEGNTDEAVKFLNNALNKGYIIELNLKLHPMYRNLRQHPQWEMLLAKSDLHATKEREKFLQMEMDESSTDK